MVAKRLDQPSLAGGELDPALWGRVDLAKYKSGFKQGRNFFLHAHGGASNRPGLGLTGTAKYADRPYRTVSFISATDDSYVLEFGDLYMRVWRFGQPVMDPVLTTQQFELATPWGWAILRELKFTQSNDVLTVTHRSTEVREIARYASNDWRMTTVSFVPTMTIPGTPTVVTTAATAGTALQSYDYKITAVSAQGDESLPSPASASQTLNLGLSGNKQTLSWSAVAGADHYMIYKSDNGYYGIVGTTPGTTFVDANIKADITSAPPGSNNPFAGNVNPVASTYFQQRRFFGGSDAKPQTIWATKSANFYNMSKSTPVRDDDAVEFSLASRQIQAVLHLVALGDLLAFTKSAEWKITGAKDDIITPSSISGKPQSEYGCSPTLAPIIIGNQVLFVQSKGQTVRDLGYRFDVDRYTGDDLSILARHIFKGRTIVAWAYAQVPEGLVICVLSDGTVGCLTYMREQEVWGWTTWDTPGFIEDVCVVPESGEDVIYLAVRRYVGGTDKRFLERMRSRQWTRRADAFFVDCGLSYLGNPKTITGWSGSTFTAPGHGLSVGSQVEIRTLQASLRGTSIDASFTVSFATTDTFTLQDPITGAAYTPPTTSQIGMSMVVLTKVSVLSGLNHLEGETVVGLADGAVVGDGGELVVSGGTVTLSQPAAVVHLGLRYTARFESLEMVQGTPDALGVIKTVNEVMIQVKDTSGCFFGASDSTLVEVKPRGVNDVPGTPPGLVTGKLTVVPGTGSDYFGRIVVTQPYPLPVTLLALMPEIEYDA